MIVLRVTLAVCSFLATPAAADEMMAPLALNSLSAAPANMASAKVMDQNGHMLGQVRQVQTDAFGRPAALEFQTSDGRRVVIGAAAVSYDGAVLVADDSQPQIAALVRPQQTAAK